MSDETPTTGFAQRAFGTAGTSGLGVQPTGTVVKFSPVQGTDTSQKRSSSQQINTRLMSVTSMKEYAGKSFEELRFEDYSVNQKGPQPATSLLGQTTAQPSMFGAQTGTTGMFGSQHTENISPFGTTTTLGGFGTSGGSAPLFIMNINIGFGATPFGSAPNTQSGNTGNF